MNKYIVMILVTLAMTACTVKDERYYRSNPKELQKVAKACPLQEPKGLSCSKIEELVSHMNELAYQLQLNPQGFGHGILALQETLANQRLELKNNKDNEILKNRIEKNKQSLADRLSVVKWLESPES